MLILSRKVGETIQIAGTQITVKVVDIKGGRIRLGIEAPLGISIHRGEVKKRIDDEKR